MYGWKNEGREVERKGDINEMILGVERHCSP